MKHRFLPTILLLALVLSILSPFASAAPADAGVTINVYNWGMYISDGTDGGINVNKAFTEATGIKVNYMNYDSNESMYTKLKTGGSTYDVIIPSDYMIARLLEEDMLEPINFDNVPNYQYIDQAFRDQPYDPENQYSVPYTWGTVGLIYNSKYVTEEVTSWDTMWNPAYSGKILMFDNPRDSFAISELLLGYDLNTEDANELTAAANKLKEQKPLVQSYVMDQIFYTMERSEAWVAAYYAGDYLLMSQKNEDLKFCYPKEGFNVFIDAMCIPKGCQNKEAAEAYINFLCDPEISGKNMEYLGYSTPISAAKEYMDPEIVNNPIAYPDEETLSRATSFMNLSTETTQQMDSLWLDVKTDSAAGENGGNNTMIIVAAVLVAAVVVILIVVNNNKRKKLAARKKAGQ